MNDGSEIHHEIEIKLDLGSFTNYLKLIGFLGQIDHEEKQINSFFDSEDRQLSKAGWALRIRAENSRGLVTIKSIPSQKGLAVVRQEIEAEIPRGQAIDIIHLRQDVMALPVMPIEFIRSKVRDNPLSRLVLFENTRQKKVFRMGDSNYLLEVDKTEYNDGSVDYELELELQDTTNLETIEGNLMKLFYPPDAE